jgi:hypothetical protein
VRQYCATHAVPVSTFQLWRRAARAASRSMFARVEVLPAAPDRALRLVVRGARGLEVEVTGLDPSLLPAALSAVLR